MNSQHIRYVSFIFVLLLSHHFANAQSFDHFAKDQQVHGFRVVNLYSSTAGITGAKFVHIQTGTPVIIMQMETVPQVLTWADTPVEDNRGLPHALEHLLIGKGTTGRKFNLLREMRLGESSARTSRAFVYYGLSSDAGGNDFFELFHALLEALYHPDFTDAEAEQEFYHFVVTGTGSKKKLIEAGTVYNEMQAVPHRYDYYFALNKLLFGKQSPFAFDSRGEPDDMREVSPKDIRQYHARYYHPGPSTGFIFVFPPKMSILEILERISGELSGFAGPGHTFTRPHEIGEPRYPIDSLEDHGPQIYPFVGASDSAPAIVHVAWRPSRISSARELKLLHLLIHGLGGGEGSLLQRRAVDSSSRLIDTHATGVDAQLILENSAAFPVPVVEFSGIPGDRTTPASLEELRTLVVNTLRQLSEAPDGSEIVKQFNRSSAAYARSLERDEVVSSRSAPGFGSLQTGDEWKTHFELLELNPSFVRSTTEKEVWRSLDAELASSNNIWRELINSLHLLEMPYVTAAIPSNRLLNEIENEKKKRVEKKTAELASLYHTTDEAAALDRFQKEQSLESREVDLIDSRTPHFRFTDHPPMTPDGNIRFKQFRIASVPAFAVLFRDPPTIDVDISFDLNGIPAKFYKYLPLLPNTLDSLGLKSGDLTLSYSDLLEKIQAQVYALSTGYEISALSHRKNLAIKISAVSEEECERGLALARDLITSNYLDNSNISRLRDLVNKRIAKEDAYIKQDIYGMNAAYSFRYRTDALFFALNSHTAMAHSVERLRWLLHEPVTKEQIGRLVQFSNEVLSSGTGISEQDMKLKLADLKVAGLESELLDYWKKNLESFPETGLASGLRRLAEEVTQDLAVGPDQTIKDLKHLQKLVMNRTTVRFNLIASSSEIGYLRRTLAKFLLSLPDAPSETMKGVRLAEPAHSEVRSQGSASYLAFVNPEHVTGSVAFYSDFPGFDQRDRKSLVTVLASKLYAGSGPKSLFMKTWERGLAYSNGIASDPSWRVIWYQATRVPSVPALLKFVDSVTSSPPSATGNAVDYALSQVFSFSRASMTFSERGRALAHDVQDGNDPDMIKRFSEAILRLRNDPTIDSDLMHSALPAICGVILNATCKDQHNPLGSLFLFVGNRQAIDEIQKELEIPELQRVYASELWLSD